MNHTYSHFSPTSFLSEGKKERIAFGVAIAIVLLVVFFHIFLFFLFLVRDSSDIPINEEITCNSLQLRMSFFQGESVGDPTDAGISYPSLENSELVRKVYHGGEDIGICTIRMRQPNGEENLYTFIRALNGPVTLSSSDEEDSENNNCEAAPPENPNCNIFGPYNNHYTFMEVL